MRISDRIVKKVEGVEPRLKEIKRNLAEKKTMPWDVADEPPSRKPDVAKVEEKPVRKEEPEKIPEARGRPKPKVTISLRIPADLADRIKGYGYGWTRLVQEVLQERFGGKS